MIMVEIWCRMEVVVVINFTGFFSLLQTWLPGNINCTILSKAPLLSLRFLLIHHSKQTKAKPGLCHCKALSSQPGTVIAVLKPEQLK